MAYFLTAHCPPPHVNLAPPTSIAPEAALTLIETYLSSTTEQPHLHPDCRFNDAGPTLEGRPPGGNIALHQLGRIARGLKGERLVPEVDSEAALRADDQDGAAAPPEDQENATLVTMPDDSMAVEGEFGLDKSVQQRHTGSDHASSSDDDEHHMVEKSYGQQMREQGEDGITIGEIGDRDAGVITGGDVPQVKTLGSKESKKGKRKLTQASPQQMGDTLDDAGPHTDKKKRKKKHRAVDSSE